MAAYFTLTSKHTGERESFSLVDERICDHLDVPVHPKRYYAGWYDCIGLAIAMGHDWPKIRELFVDETELLKVADYIEANYDTDHWMGR